ncbi:MAG TPA: fructosamine kinase family protein [Flavisolibacter sp.]|nr:fructosamine kinase family protein [Flavisolibacter sp.]
MNPSPALQTAIQQKLTAHFSFAEKINFSAVGGGSINNTYCISFGSQSVFCKINSATKFPQLFAKEKSGLELIQKQGIIKTPCVIDHFEHENQQVLLLEWIVEGERTESFWKSFGQQLAALHQQSLGSFGLEEDNYMGSVPQSNRIHQDWISFFTNERLQPMTRRCFDKNLLTKNHLQAFENLQQKLTGIFEKENPSLLHGDLCSGNFMCNRSGEPVLIDPAVYYGHRSVDLAMTTMFGGFRQPFYEAYNYHYPLPKNYEEQWAICNFYPLLIHLYLFGSSYLPQIERTLRVFA